MRRGGGVAGAPWQPADPVAGHTRSGRYVVAEITVEARPDAVLALWTTVEGVRQFLAADARIEPHQGGRYEMIFAPDIDPHGLSHGTSGARLLAFEPGRRVVFEWISFVADEGPVRPGSPPASSVLRAERPIPTWVEVSVTADPARPARTRVRLEHHGFRAGTGWDEAFDYFERAWQQVLNSLETYCRTGRSPLDGRPARR